MGEVSFAQKKKALEATKLYADYCILTYQIYAQTTYWKIDPFTETLGRDGYRKQLFERLKAPPVSGSALGAKHLEPITFFYDAISPRDGVYFRGGTKEHTYFRPPSFADNVNRVFYSAREKNDWVLVKCRDYGHGPIDLYCFEGESGHSVKHLAADGRHLPGQRSIFGFVAHDTSAADPKLVIAFRGSRSGSFMRAAFHGLVSGKGNADWVSDMGSIELAAAGDIADEGKVGIGFGAIFLSCLPSLNQVLLHIFSGEHGARIGQVVTTGHSLGGAVALMCKLAFKLGSYHEVLRKQLAPLCPGRIDQVMELFAHSACYTYGAPAAIDAALLKLLGDANELQRYLISNDLVTRVPVWLNPRLQHAGEQHKAPPRPGLSRKGAHYPEEIRDHAVQQQQAELEASEGNVHADETDSQVPAAGERLWVNGKTLDELIRAAPEAKDAYLRAFHLEYFAYLFDELIAVYLERHHRRKRSLNLSRNSPADVARYRKTVDDAARALAAGGALSLTGEPELQILAFIRVRLDELAQLQADPAVDHHQPSLLGDRLDELLTELVKYLRSHSGAATLVRYAVDNLANLLTCLKRDAPVLAEIRRL